MQLAAIDQTRHNAQLASMWVNNASAALGWGAATDAGISQALAHLQQASMYATFARDGATPAQRGVISSGASAVQQGAALLQQARGVEDPWRASLMLQVRHQLTTAESRLRSV